MRDIKKLVDDLRDLSCLMEGGGSPEWPTLEDAAHELERLSAENARLLEIERLAKEFFTKTKQYKTTFMDAPIVVDHVIQKEAIQKWVCKTEAANDAKTEAESNLYEAIFATMYEEE